MFLPSSNVQVKLAGDKAAAEQIIFGCGTAPCWTLVVNAARHPSIDVFLRRAKPMSDLFAIASSSDVVEGGLRVARANIGSGVDLDRLGWHGLDAVLMADSFEKIAGALAEFERAAS